LGRDGSGGTAKLNAEVISPTVLFRQALMLGTGTLNRREMNFSVEVWSGLLGRCRRASVADYCEAAGSPIEASAGVLVKEEPRFRIPNLFISHSSLNLNKHQRTLIDPV
jgi:hypothetical protein